MKPGLVVVFDASAKVLKVALAERPFWNDTYQTLCFLDRLSWLI